MQSSSLEITNSSFASTNVEPTLVTLAISDPEVLLALADYPEGPARTTFLVSR
jgi:hypothetical protein